MSTPLRVAIAGLGRLGHRHAQQLAWRTRHCQLVAAVSPTATELQSARNLGVTLLSSELAPILARDDIDAVVLATPTSLHADQSIAVLRAGKHLFVEKPLGLTLEDCQRVEAEAALHPQLVAMVGFVRRFDQSYVNAKKEVAAGTIGRPFLIRSQTCDQKDPSGYFVRFSATSGGLFMDCSIHDIDLARWFLGAPRATTAYAQGLCAVHKELAQVNPQDVDNGLGIVSFADHSQALLYASRTYTLGHETSTEIIGDEGKLLVGAGAARDRLIIGDRHGVRQLAVADFYERFADAFATEMQAFVDACRGEAPLPLQLSDATEATRIGLAVTKSFRSNQIEVIA